MPLCAQEQLARPIQAVIEGTVYDTISGRPISFVVVSVASTNLSTLTNRSGRYRLVVPRGEWQLEFRRIGHRMTSVTIQVTESASSRDVFMHPVPIELEALIVTPENPALRIIREALARKNDVLSRIHDYRYDAYAKLVIRDLEKDEGSSDAIFLITETQTTAYWQQPDKYQETITARRQSSNLDAENNLVSVGQIENFNRDRIEIGPYSVVSPTADDALDHYNYYMLDTLALPGGTVFRLAIEPKSNAVPRFVGIIDIADSTYDVLAIDVGANDAIRFDFVKNMRYSQRLVDHGDDRWMPDEIRFSGEVHFGIPIPGIPRHLFFEHVASLEDFRFDEGDAPPTLGEFVIVVEDNADDLDGTAWDTLRTTPLTDVEFSAYERIDSLENQPASLGDRMLDGLGLALLLGTESDFFHFNRAEGVYLGAGSTYRDLSPNVVLRAKLGYAFGREAWQYRFGGRFRLSERQRIWVGGYYQKEIVNRATSVSTSYNPTFLALFARLDPLDYYEEQGFSVTLRTKLLNFVRLELWYNDFDQSSVDAVTDYSLFNVERTQRANLPIVDGKLRSVSAILSYDSRPLLKMKGRDYYLAALTLTRVTIGAEFASPDFIPNDFDFRRYFVRLHRRQRTFGMGLTTIDAYAGIATGRLPTQNYFTIDFGRGAFFQAGGFNTLNETNFSGNRAAMVVVRHDFDQLLFRKTGLPLIKQVPFTLMIHGGLFWTDFVNHTANPSDALLRTAPTAYSEVGFGIGNLTPFISPINFAAYFTWQVSSYDTTRFEFRIGAPGP